MVECEGQADLCIRLELGFVGREIVIVVCGEGLFAPLRLRA